MVASVTQIPGSAGSRGFLVVQDLHVSDAPRIGRQRSRSFPDIAERLDRRGQRGPIDLQTLDDRGLRFCDDLRAPCPGVLSADVA
jgi:hypothetical protein